jgi:type I restriction enzyme S subunit
VKCEWKTVALDEIATIERSAIQPSAISQGTAYLGLEHIESGGKILGAKPVDEGELASSKFKFTERHLLYGKLRPYLAKIACPDFTGICSTDILPILPGPHLERRFLCYFLRQPSMVDYANSRATGANLPRLSPSALARLEIPLPPLAEQRRIAEVLDKAEALRAKRRAALAQLDSLTQSLFLDLFGDTREKRTRWATVPLEEIVKETKLGLVRGSQEFGPEFEIPYVRMNAITRNGELELGNVQRTHATDAEIESYRLEPGDFLFNTRNSEELVGKTALYRGGGLHLFNNNLMRVRFTAKADPIFVAAAFKTTFVQHELNLRKSGTTNVFAIYYKDLRSLPLPLPPISLQREFARRVAAVEKLKTAQRAALAELDALFASLQHRAFRGEL